MNKIKELEEKILLARQAYYNTDVPIMSDTAFDSLIDELTALDPNNKAITNIGSDLPQTSPWVKVTHTTTVGSLNKVHNFEDFNKWCDKYCKSPFLSLKLDGLTLVLFYKDGILDKAVSRGSGYEGEDLYLNAIKIPSVLRKIPLKGDVLIRGEVLFETSKFEELKSTYSNPRNAASGIIRAYSGEHCEKLDFYAYKITTSVFRSDFKIDSESIQFDLLNEWGFKTPEHKLFSSPLEVGLYKKSLDRKSLNYLIDGLVIRENDLSIQNSFGEVNDRPKAAIAFKFEAEGALSTITSIDFQVGSTGIITPVAYFEPVLIEDAMIKKSSLYNFDYVDNLRLNVGNKVLIVRAGQVIPRIEENLDYRESLPIDYPKNCPECNSPTIFVGSYLKCSEPSKCTKALKGKIIKYIKAMNIMEWGDKLIDQLFENNLVSNISDLYKLSEADLSNLPRMGEKSAKNCIDALNNSKHVSLQEFLGAIGVPGCSESTFKLLTDIGYNDLDNILSITSDKLSQVKGLGEVKISEILNFFKNHDKEIRLIYSFLKIKKPTSYLKNKTFCFTGKFISKKRGDLESIVNFNGGSVSNTVSSTTNFLVTNDTTSGSSKNKKANELNIPILTEEGFLELMKELTSE